MWWSTGSGLIELNITKAQAARGSHQGQCIDDIRALLQVPKIQKQLDKLDPVLVSKELREYGAWNEEERADHTANLERLLWIACGDINEGL